jgi:hypothetical protein
MTLGDLEARLNRLAPAVDVDAARTTITATSTHPGRRWILLSGLGVVVASFVALAFLNADDETTTIGTLDGDVSTHSSGDGIEVTVTSPRVVVAGTTMTFEAEIVNHGNEEVFWQAGGCGTPLAGVAGPIGSTDLPFRETAAKEWSGDLETLDDSIAKYNSLSVRRPSLPEGTSNGRGGCPDVSRMVPLAVDETITYRGIVEFRVPPGPLPNGGGYELRLRFAAYDAAESYPGEARGPVEVRVPIEVKDDPARSVLEPAEAIDEFRSESEFGEWIASARRASGDLSQAFSTEMAWWRGGWELSVAPQWVIANPLVLRLDPQTRSVERLAPEG